jgi:hypothetical protein
VPPTPERIPIAVPLGMIAMGLVFVVFGLARPDFIWTTGKVVQGREWMGDTGMSALFAGFGGVFSLAGLAFLIKRP